MNSETDVSSRAIRNMDKNEVKAWAGVITAVLGAVFLAEKVIDKTCCLFSRFTSAKNSSCKQAETDDDVNGIIA